MSAAARRPYDHRLREQPAPQRRQAPAPTSSAPALQDSSKPHRLGLIPKQIGLIWALAGRLGYEEAAFRHQVAAKPPQPADPEDLVAAADDSAGGGNGPPADPPDPPEASDPRVHVQSRIHLRVGASYLVRRTVISSLCDDPTVAKTVLTPQGHRVIAEGPGATLCAFDYPVDNGQLYRVDEIIVH